MNEFNRIDGKVIKEFFELLPSWQMNTPFVIATNPGYAGRSTIEDNGYIKEIIPFTLAKNT